MTAGERRIAELRAARDAAREAFDQRLGRAKVDLQPTALRQRVVADAKVKAMALATEAIEIANDSRGVVIGTGAALALWFARRPLGRAATEIWSHRGASKPEPNPFGTAAQWLADRLSRALDRAREEMKNND